VKTLVVGDVHGCSAELAALLESACADRVELVGDLFTKGPDPAGVFAQVHAHRSVLGNHDARLLDALDGRRPDDAGAWRTIAALDEGAPGWRDWTRALPYFAEAAGFTVVHAGLHPSGALERTSRDMALTMRRYPPDFDDAPLWYDVYDGNRSVVFGHDAMRGLVRRERDGRPWLIGLDTGCVYGGSLSGYVVEEDRIVQVRAARVYRVPSSA
jgi:hypothetical protein